MLSPILQFLPIPAHAYLPKSRNRIVIRGGISGGIVCVAEGLLPQLVDAVYDVLPPPGLRLPSPELHQRDIYGAYAVECVVAVQQVNALALIPDKALRRKQVLVLDKFVRHSDHASIDVDGLPHRISQCFIWIRIRTVNV